MRGIYGFIPLIIVLLAGATGVAFYRPIARWFKTNRELSIGAVLGEVTHVEGSVRRMHGEDIELLPINQDHRIELRDGDVLQASLYSSANLILAGGNQYGIPPGSVVKFNLWQPGNEESPVYIHIEAGELNPGNLLEPGRIFIIRGGKMLATTLKPLSGKLELLVKVPSYNQPKPVAPRVLPLTPETTQLSPDTLSDEFIQSSVEANLGKFQTCWAKFQRGGTDKGHLEIDFDIAKTGTAENVEFVKKTLSDETLLSCMKAAFTAVTFRPYSGSALHKSYSLEFE